MTERRVMPSHPDYDKLNELALMLSIAHNPQIHFNTKDATDKVEQAGIIAAVENAMEQELEGGVLHDFITLMDMGVDTSLNTKGIEQ